MLGLQSCGKMVFLFYHVSHRDRVPQRQGSAEETVQQREFLVLPVEICLKRFHGGLIDPRAGINVSGGDWVLRRQHQGREIWEVHRCSAKLGQAARAMAPFGGTKL